MKKRKKQIIQSPNKGMSFALSLDMKKRILVADDDEDIRNIFGIILKNAGYEADLVSNGKDLLNDNFKIPDLFLIDKQLSGVNGLDVCRHLKSNKKTKRIPLLMISASPDIGILSEKAGADGCIEKPFELKEVISTIESFLSLKKKTLVNS